MLGTPKRRWYRDFTLEVYIGLLEACCEGPSTEVEIGLRFIGAKNLLGPLRLLELLEEEEEDEEVDCCCEGPSTEVVGWECAAEKEVEIGLLFIGAKNLPGPLRLLELLEEEEEEEDDEEVDCCCEGPSTEVVGCECAAEKDVEIGLLFIGAKNLPGPLRLLELLEEEEEEDEDEVDCCCEGPSTEEVGCECAAEKEVEIGLVFVGAKDLPGPLRLLELLEEEEDEDEEEVDCCFEGPSTEVVGCECAAEKEVEIGLVFVGAKDLPGPLRLLELLEEEEDEEETVDCCCDGPSTESVDCQVVAIPIGYF